VPRGPCRITKNDTLVLPIRNARTNKFISVQYITPDGEKKYAKGHEKKGGCCILGNLDDPGTIAIVEGYTTGGQFFVDLIHPYASVFRNRMRIYPLLPVRVATQFALSPRRSRFALTRGLRSQAA